MKQSFALIGPGRVGCAISKRLYQAGYPITAVVSRQKQRAIEACTYIGCSTKLASIQYTCAETTQIILLAVPDDSIESVAHVLQTKGKTQKQTALVHFSGLHSADIMSHDKSTRPLLSLHPLLPFPDSQTAFNNLKQCPCALEGNGEEALILGKQLTTAIGGAPFTLNQNTKVLYHAAACIASNYLVTLAASARDLLVKCGMKPGQATPLLQPLMQASLNNAINLGPEQGLSGPIVRGDIGTVMQHLQALKDDAPELLQSYLSMGQLTADVSEKSGRLNQEMLFKIQQFLSTEAEKTFKD